jgi:catechol 2,3-dioxygenase-like lactoylglutathione lyase family enzyme
MIFKYQLVSEWMRWYEGSFRRRAMGLAKLGHYSIRTADIEASRRFYVEIMGLRVGFRPPFAFRGLWLYLGEDESDFGVVHLIAVEPGAQEGLSNYLGERSAEATAGTGALDHIAFLATGWPDLKARLAASGQEIVERTVPLLGLHQVFVTDPSGVTIELNYPSAEA